MAVTGLFYHNLSGVHLTVRPRSVFKEVATEILLGGVLLSQGTLLNK